MARSEEDNKWLEKIYKNTKGSNVFLKDLKGIAADLKGVLGGVVGNLLSLFTDAVTMGAKMEEVGARFGASFNSMSDDMHTLSDTMQKSGVPANVYEAMILKLQANRLGLDLNTKSVQQMYKVSLATGENFNTWGQGILNATIGTRESTEAQGRLFTAVENNSRTFNMTRTELVGALKSLNRSTTNLFAATGGSVAAAGEFTTMMRGLLPDQALFGEAMNTFNRQFTMGGITESIAMGFPVNSILDGNATSAEMLQVMLEQGSMAQSLLSKNGRTAIIGNEAMKGAFGDLASKIAVREGILKRAEMLLGKAEIEGLNEKELSIRLHAESKRKAKEQQDLTNTWNMIKREIVTPFINEGAKFFVSVKELFGAAWLRGALKEAFRIFGEVVFGFGKLLIIGIQKVADFFGFEEIAKSMRGVTASMNKTASTIKSKWNSGAGGSAIGSNPPTPVTKATSPTATTTPTTTTGGAAIGTGTNKGKVTSSTRSSINSAMDSPPEEVNVAPPVEIDTAPLEEAGKETNDILGDIRQMIGKEPFSPFTPPAFRIQGVPLGSTGGNY
jgi:hypothetical protein